MRKRKFLCSLLSVLGVASIIGGALNFCGSNANVAHAVKTKAGSKYNNSGTKEKLKKKIKSAKKVLSAVSAQSRKLKKWQNSLNQYVNIKEKKLKDFENKMIENLVHDFNQDISRAKYIMKCFGCSDYLINLIFDGESFKNDSEPSINIKFKKVMCCPEIIVQIDKKFDSAEELKAFRKEVWNEKVFLYPTSENNICKMCIILVNSNTLDQ